MLLQHAAQRTTAAAAAGASGSQSAAGGLVHVARRALSSSSTPSGAAGGSSSNGEQQQARSSSASAGGGISISSSSSSSSSKRPRPVSGVGVQQRQQQPLSTHAKRSSNSHSSFDEEEHGDGYQQHQELHRRFGPAFFSFPHVHVAPPAAAPAHEVIFVRHGQSTWNRANRFIGWCDTPLTEQGLEEARTAGQILRRHKVAVDEVHTSLLKRSVKTACLILEELGLERVPVRCHWRLNERSYGALVGQNKKECVAQHGAEQVKLWRRSYDVPPPPQDPNSRYYPGKDGRKYAALLAQGGSIPLTESLRDVRARAARHWEEVVVPSIRAGRRVCVVGHENNMRGLLMHLEGISEAAIPQLEIPRAVPLRYQFDAYMRPIRLPNAAPLLSGSFLINQKEVEALQERDRRQVYDLNVRINLEECDARHVMAALSGTGFPPNNNNPKQPSSTTTTKPAASHRHQHQQQAPPPMAAAAFSTRAGTAAVDASAEAPVGVGKKGLAEAVRAAWGALSGVGHKKDGEGKGKPGTPTTTAV